MADSGLYASFSGWGMEHEPNQSWFSSNSLYPLMAVKPRTALTAHLCPPPHLSTLCGTAFFLSEWLWSAFCTTDKTSGTRKKKNKTKKRNTTKPTASFFFPPYKLFLNICGYDSSKSTSTQRLPHYRNPFPCGCLFLSSSCHRWTPKHPRGNAGPSKWRRLVCKGYRF